MSCLQNRDGLNLFEFNIWKQRFQNTSGLFISVDPQFRDTVISPGNISYSKFLLYPEKRLFVPRILIETNGEHKSPSSFTIITMLNLKHYTSIAIKKARDVGKLFNFRSTSHGIVLKILWSSSISYHIQDLSNVDMQLENL